MSYDEEMFRKWREARVKFISDNPDTAQALSLKVPSPTGDEHIASEHCWCGPEVSYIDPQMGFAVYMHKRLQ